MALRRAHGLNASDVTRITVETFHEAVRLATATPQTTEDAQYSTSFPCAVALVRGDVTPADITDDALCDPEILRLSQTLVMTEDTAANAAFPNTRLARVTLELADGRAVQSDWMQPRWDHTAPPTPDELAAKFHTYAGPVLGDARTSAIDAAISALDTAPLIALTDLLFQPIKP
ncbi:hypothetical protein [Octadecabacter sp. R77987]|uniref:hypothetical protein n=1 Tax=Octadecabacter sp. R77987 TaxID=3093874 RepID=UPI003670BC33